MKKYNCIIITGTTASGKTKLACKLAHEMNAEIISLDSRQVYKGLNIGTGKDLDEYIIDGTPIPYHLIDIADIQENFHLQKFIEHFIEAYQDIMSRNKTAILCGGTGLYLDAILKQHSYAAVPIDEDLRERLRIFSHDELLKKFNIYENEFSTMADISSSKRLIRAIEISEYLQRHELPKTDFPELRPLIYCIKSDRDERRKRISARLTHRIKNGMIEEVNTLIKSGYSADRLQFLGLEYKYVTSYILGKINYDEMFGQLETAIHQFAKRQMTWYRKMEREGNNLNWIAPDYPIQNIIENYK
ncbi:MAG: tRNA (adenosine(37)-N6)-dimethylallyltransferase MiaA [Bacteroidetes bacterium]|nr:tRNA (adenosine(37)-N6)-dimethylallyltransferase MiaA [Bacteroidota bacterium]